MAVNYTKVFTVIGAYVDKVIDYYAHVATYASDQTSIEGVLAAQSLVRLADGLASTFAGLKQDVSSEVSALTTFVTQVLTDDTLIGQNFAFGQDPNLTIVFPALFHDMVLNTQTIKANTATVGTPTYVSTNANVGVLFTATKLDGVTPPIDGAPSLPGYLNVTSQLTPTSETITFTCTDDSEHGVERGSEPFQITGTGAAGGGYSPTGENVGTLGTINVVDNTTGQYMSNASFDSWGATSADSWTTAVGVYGTNFTQGTSTLFGVGASLEIIPQDDPEILSLENSIPNSALIRKKAYFVGLWAKKKTDVGADITMSIRLADDNGNYFVNSFTPTNTTWTFYGFQFIPPIAIAGDVTLSLGYSSISGAAGSDRVIIDQVQVAPCEYHAGVAMMISGGPDKFLIGDTISIVFSNNDVGKFQTFFRKAYQVQLPSSGSPTISDSLVA